MATARRTNSIELAMVRDCVLRSAREFFFREGYTEITTPTLTSIAGSCEDPTSLFTLDYFGRRAYLVQTGQLYLESYIAELGMVYTITHSFRVERGADKRHLVEFVLVEAEAADMELDSLLTLQQRLIRAVANSLLAFCDTAKGPGLNRERLVQLQSPFGRFTYDEALKLLAANERPIPWGSDLNRACEAVLTSAAGPCFVTHFPESIKFFNMKRDPSHPGTVQSSDLILPEVGETVGSSVREENVEVLLERLKRPDFFSKLRIAGASVDDYEWYLELVRKNPVPHAGFGLGLERLVQFVCGLDSISDATEFPRNSEVLFP